VRRPGKRILGQQAPGRRAGRVCRLWTGHQLGSPGHIRGLARGPSVVCRDLGPAFNLRLRQREHDDNYGQRTQ